MSPGYQGVQSQHAAIQFMMEHSEIAKHWFGKSNYLGWLSVANEKELHRLVEEALLQGIPVSVFREPDVDDEVTAIAIAPGPQSRKLCSKLQLALKTDWYSTYAPVAQ